MHVSIVGAGYVGLVTGLCLAERGHRVTCIDVDSDKLEKLTQGVLPIHEPGLAQLLRRHLSIRFFPTPDLAGAVRVSDVTMITVGTPIENGGINLRYVANAAAAIGHALAGHEDYHVVVVKSTVVPGTTDELVGPILEDASGLRSGTAFGLGMNPEFLREGEAVNDFLNPDRIVVGGIDDRSRETIARLYESFTGAKLIETNTRTAEMIKYASNALLATLISFSNEVGNLCSEAGGVDALDVLGAVHLDRRISPTMTDGRRVTPEIASYLKAGCGFGGSCFPKDVTALVRWGEEHHRPTRLLSAVLETNDHQPGEVLALLKRHFPELNGLTVAVLGLSFKPDTDDVRASPALRVIPLLLTEGATVVAYDPVATDAARASLGRPDIRFATTMEQAVEGADAVVLLTAWAEFLRLPDLLLELAAPPLVIDGRRILDKRRVARYEGIGLSVPIHHEQPPANGATAGL